MAGFIRLGNLAVNLNQVEYITVLNNLKAIIHFRHGDYREYNPGTPEYNTLARFLDNTPNMADILDEREAEAAELDAYRKEKEKEAAEWEPVEDFVGPALVEFMKANGFTPVSGGYFQQSAPGQLECMHPSCDEIPVAKITISCGLSGLFCLEHEPKDADTIVVVDRVEL